MKNGVTRRGLFGLFAGAVAAPAVVKLLPAPALDPSFRIFNERLVLMDLEAQYIRPAMMALANDIDFSVQAFCRQHPMKVGDTYQVRKPVRMFL